MIRSHYSILALVALLSFYANHSALALDTQTNLGVGVEAKDKLSTGPKTLYVKGQWALELIRVLRLNAAVAVTRPHSMIWFEGQGNAQLYPLSLFVPREFRFLPYLSAGAITRNSAKGHLLAAGFDFLGTQRAGINFSGAQATLDGQKSTRIEFSLFWR